MDEKKSKNNPNSEEFNPYNSYHQPYQINNQNYPNSNEIMEFTRHLQIVNLLESIRNNGERQARDQRDGVYTNFTIVFLILVFFIYMIVGFYQAGGFDSDCICKLLVLIIVVFIMVVLLHRHEINITQELNKNNYN